MSNKQKLSVCSLKDKLDALTSLDKVESGMKLAVEFGMVKTIVSDWKKITAKLNSLV